MNLVVVVKGDFVTCQENTHAVCARGLDVFNKAAAGVVDVDVVDCPEIRFAGAVKFACVLDFEVFQNLVFYAVQQNTAKPTRVGLVGVWISVNFLRPAVFQNGFIGTCAFNAFDVDVVAFHNFDLERQFVRAFFQFHHRAVFLGFFQLHHQLDGIAEFACNARQILTARLVHSDPFFKGFLAGHNQGKHLFCRLSDRDLTSF